MIGQEVKTAGRDCEDREDTSVRAVPKFMGLCDKGLHELWMEMMPKLREVRAVVERG